MGRKKKEVVEKVASETGVEAKDLERLPEDALEKLDALVPDSSEEPSEVVVEGKRYVGKHPITGEAVYM